MWKIVCNTMKYMTETRRNPADINRFRSHTEKYFFIVKYDYTDDLLVFLLSKLKLCLYNVYKYKKLELSA